MNDLEETRIILCHLMSREIVVIIDEIHLNAGAIDGGYLDNQRMICIVND